MSSVKEKRARKPFSFSEAWSVLPHVVKAPLYGLLLGILVIVILPYLWDSQFALLVGAGVTIVFILFGVVTGNAIDLREEIKDNLK